MFDPSSVVRPAIRAHPRRWGTRVLALREARPRLGYRCPGGKSVGEVRAIVDKIDGASSPCFTSSAWPLRLAERIAVSAGVWISLQPGITLV
jgi:hypothetical protein